MPAAGADATNTPFPSWRCIGNVLLNDEPAKKCNGLINRTRTVQQNGGVSGQLMLRDAFGRRRSNQFTAGAANDRSRVGFAQSTELGYLNPDRSVTGVNAFGDGVSGGEVDGEPYDARVDLNGLLQTWSVYGSDTVSLGDAWHVTVSGRYNITTLENRDRIDPGGGSGSLDGDHSFGRFNPAGVTYSPSEPPISTWATAKAAAPPRTIELGCANPDEPCKLPNAMAGDPPLDQVVTRTWEAGLRGRHHGIGWNVGVFRAGNHNDILFVTSEQSGFGYFKNFGKTLRQGLELGATGRVGRVTYLYRLYLSERDVPE